MQTSDATRSPCCAVVGDITVSSCQSGITGGLRFGAHTEEKELCRDPTCPRGKRAAADRREQCRDSRSRLACEWDSVAYKADRVEGTHSDSPVRRVNTAASRAPSVMSRLRRLKLAALTFGLGEEVDRGISRLLRRRQRSLARRKCNLLPFKRASGIEFGGTALP